MVLHTMQGRLTKLHTMQGRLTKGQVGLATTKSLV
jgi:hypothetical protein